MPHSINIGGVDYPQPHAPGPITTYDELLASGWTPSDYVEPPAPQAVVDFWKTDLSGVAAVDWTAGPVFGEASTWTGPTPGTGVQKDIYGGDFSDPFGQLMFSTFGALGERAYGAGAASAAAAAAAGSGLVGALPGAAGWAQDMTKLAVLGLGALALIMVAK